MPAHASPAQIRSNLSHPIVDGDGHRLEYAPVFSEKMRFENAVRLWGTQNPRFFEGTVVAKEAASVLNAAQPMHAAAE